MDLFDIPIESPVNGTSPKVRFRWSQTIQGTKEVSLVLTSITGTQIYLVWQPNLGWYESDPISLPTGLHTGFLVIAKKVYRSLLRDQNFLSKEPPTKGSHIFQENDYKVDPFYISPHKLAIELFLQDDQPHHFWEDAPNLRRRYLSSQNTHNVKKRNEDFRKCYSDQELRRRVHWSIDICHATPLDSCRLFETQTGRETSYNKKLSCSSQATSSGVEVFAHSSVKSPSLPNTNLRKWSSLGDPNYFSSVSAQIDSSYHSKSQIFDDEEGACEHSPSATSLQVSKTSRSDGDQIFHGASSPKESLLFKSIENPAFQELNRLSIDSHFTPKDIESLLYSSESDFEEDFPNEEPRSSSQTREGYGCLITFESRSTSLADLGSPRALEDVLVSLTSSDTDAKHSNLFEIQSNFCEKGYDSLHIPSDSEHIVLQEPNLSLNLKSPNKLLNSYSTEPERTQDLSDINSVESCNNNSDDQTDSKDSESITINEDINFQYDSLQNDEEKFSLNIQGVNSDDSLENCVGRNIKGKIKPSLDIPVTKPTSNVTDHKVGHAKVVQINDVNIERNAFLEPLPLPVSPKISHCESDSYVFSDRSDGRINPLVLMHPGSLRSSETETVPTVRNLVANKSQGTLNLNKSVGFDDCDNSESTETLINSAERSAEVQNLQKADHISPHKKMNLSRYTEIYNFPSNSSRKHVSYDILPNKFLAPCKEKNGDLNYCTFRASENLQFLQRRLYNIVHADNILRKIDPKSEKKLQNSKVIEDDNFHFLSKSLPVNRKRDPSLFTTLGMNSSAMPKTLGIPPSTKPKFTSQYFPVKKTLFVKDSSSQTPSNCYVPKEEMSNPSSFSYYRNNGALNLSYSYARTGIQYTPKPLEGKMLHSVKSLPNLSYLRTNANYPSYPKDYASFPHSRNHGREFFPRWASATSLEYRENGFTGVPDAAYKRPFNRFSTREPSYNSSHRKAISRRHSEGTFNLISHSEDSDNSGGSTDSLVDEADCIINGSPIRKNKKVRRRTRSSYSRKKPVYVSKFFNNQQSYQHDSSQCFLQSQNSIKRALQTHSETDLRLVGCLTEGRYGNPPYLPYRKEQLTIGQMVKVLVPGEGVALARVVYTSSSLYRGFLHKPLSQHVTVVLLSEPANLNGCVISLPMNNVLLAWPKASIR